MPSGIDCLQLVLVHFGLRYMLNRGWKCPTSQASPLSIPHHWGHTFQSYFPQLNFHSQLSSSLFLFHTSYLPVKFCTVLSLLSFQSYQARVINLFIFYKESDLLVINACPRFRTAELGQEQTSLRYTFHAYDFLTLCPADTAFSYG